MLLKHIKRIVALAVLGGVLVTGAASASASTVTVSPGGAVTGTGGGMQIVLNTARKTINCTTSRFTATYNTGGTGVTLPFVVSSNMQLAFTGCRVVGGVNVTMTCFATALLSVTGVTVAGTTSVSITRITCIITVTGSRCTAVLTGTLAGTHSNTSGQITVLTTGQALVLSGSDDGTGTGRPCASLPNDASVTLSNAAGGALVLTEVPPMLIDVR
jgi:hypothetical protein